MPPYAESLVMATLAKHEPYQLDGRLSWDPTDTIRIRGRSETTGEGLTDAPVRMSGKAVAPERPFPAGPVAAGIAAAGAGLVAYARRRNCQHSVSSDSQE